MRKSNYVAKLYLRVTYPDGRIDLIKDDAPNIRQRFKDLVNAYCLVYLGCIKIELLDNREKVWKCFEQKY